MSARIRFVDGMVGVAFNAPDATLEQMGAVAGDVLEAQHLTISQQGSEIYLQGRVVTYRPVAPAPCEWSWCGFFDRVAREIFGSRPPPRVRWKSDHETHRGCRHVLQASRIRCALLYY